MSLFKCKMCGGNLELTEGSSVATCEYCGTTQTVPSADNEKKINLFSRANRLRAACEFDKAFGIYEAIVADFPEEAEAYWGLVLCKYGIEYVDDPKTGKKIPTCHRSSFESVMDDANFDQVLENSDPLSRSIYRDEAKQIEEIRKGIVEISSKEDPYDIFICYKETDENGNRTLDSVLAQDVYDALTEKGYRVFFSRITLEDKLGQEYEPYIFAALNSAKIMLAFGSDYEYYNAVWVKNEWSRFLELISRGEKKTLIPCYKNIDAYDMPKEFAKLQAQDMGKVGAIQDLVRGIGKIINSNKGEINQIDPSKDLNEQFEVLFKEREERIARERKEEEERIAREQEEKRKAERDRKKAKRKRIIKRISIYTSILATIATWAVLVFAVPSIMWSAAHDSIQKNNRDEALSKLNELIDYQESTEFLDFFGSYDYERVSKELYLCGDAQGAARLAEKLGLPIAEAYSNVASGNYKAAVEAGLKNIVIPNDVTSIRTSAFYYCSNLTSITIPDSVTSIDIFAFEGCSSLTSINFNGTTAQWKAISKNSAWNPNTGNYTVYCTDGTISK